MEKTLKSYQEENFRLQLVNINEEKSYIIILNRKIKYKSIYYEATVRKFLSILYNKALEEKLFDIYDEEVLLNG